MESASSVGVALGLLSIALAEIDVSLTEDASGAL